MGQHDQPKPLGLAPSFGFGDRLGCATPGHLDALLAEGGPIRGIFAQQSIREMTRTRRTADEVMGAAGAALAAEGFNQPWGADADHLKTKHDVDVTAAAGFVFFTIDPSDHVDQQADTYDPATLDAKFDQVKADIDWLDQYLGRTVKLDDAVELVFDESAVRRAAVKYGRALHQAFDMGDYIAEVSQRLGRDHEIELSVDETEQPTTPAEHYIIADQCLRHGMKLISLAPRYVGDFEKGVDYIGDRDELRHSLAQHTAIARRLGPYKLSLHSGSDKLSMYGLFAQVTGGLFHVKTAGTSYLEALRVAAHHDESLFRSIIDFARQRYDTDRATYHVSATVNDASPAGEVDDAAALEGQYLECWADVPAGKGFTRLGRQILHCTFGSVLTNATLGPALRSVLDAEPDTYRRVLAEHFSRHLAALRSGMGGPA